MKDERLHLIHIVESLERIRAYAAEGREAFFEKTMIQDAVLRNFEVIGEATKRLPDAYRQNAPQIPWRQLAGLRDILIHQYEKVDLEEVWLYVEKDVDTLYSSLRELLGDVYPPKS